MSTSAISEAIVLDDTELGDNLEDVVHVPPDYPTGLPRDFDMRPEREEC